MKTKHNEELINILHIYRDILRAAWTTGASFSSSTWERLSEHDKQRIRRVNQLVDTAADEMNTLFNEKVGRK